MTRFNSPSYAERVAKANADRKERERKQDIKNIKDALWSLLFIAVLAIVAAYFKHK